METDPKDNVKDTASLVEANEIYRKLEERAIAESNDLNRRITHCRRCQRGEFLPTVGSGHPLADIMLVKYQPHYLNPLVIYGTNLVKCHAVEPEEGERNCPGFWLEEFHVTQPRIVVVMGEQALSVVNAERIAGMRELAWEPGALQDLTSFCKALVTPDIDECLDEETAKADFWKAFRNLGDWFRDEPPY